MASWALRAPGLRLVLEERSKEAIAHLSGKITAASAEMIHSEIGDHLIPISRGKGVAVNTRIVLDLSDVTFVDGNGLDALYRLSDAARKRACEVVIVNLKLQAREFVSRDKLDQVFGWMKNWFRSSETTR